MSTPHQRPRILFFCESVSLAHVARPLALATALDPTRYDIHIAAGDAFTQFLDPYAFTRHHLTCIPRETFARRLSYGLPLYDAQTLDREISEDTALLRQIQPDLVVGDFRLSLGISARQSSIPYATISNAYWSPAADLSTDVPPTAITRILSPSLIRPFFRQMQRFIFSRHARPHVRARARYNLSPIPEDLRNVYTDADHTLYMDIPELFPDVSFADTEHLLGMITWSPDVALQPDLVAWLHDKTPSTPICYVTLGSSGAHALLPQIVATLGKLPVRAVVSSAGKPFPFPVPENVRVFPFLSGDMLIGLSDLVVSNGGSPTSSQALTAGKPVVGIISNMDQMLNMERVTRQGAGILLREDLFTPQAFTDAILRSITEPSFRESADRLRTKALHHDFRENFRSFVSQTLS